MGTNDKDYWFSAAELAHLAGYLPGSLKIPTTEQNCRKKAIKQKWESRQVQSKGGPNGIRTEYRPPQDVLDAIHSYFMNDKKGVYASPDDTDTPKVKEGQAKYEVVDALFRLSAEESKPRASVKPKKYADTLYIQQLDDVRAAAGNGQVTPTDQVSVMVAINAIDWRNRVGANPEKVKIITVYGDSMEGTLSHGDQVFVDTACNKFIDDAIYVIMQDGLLRIKRVKLKLDGSILVKSDNENGFGIEEYTANQAASFNVIGKVLPFKFGQFKM